jgi:hypothetical protein
MTRQERLVVVTIIVSLLVTGLACGTGYSTTHSHRGNRGQVVVKIKSAEGSDQTSVEINEDYSWKTVTLNITVEVEAGRYWATFLDDDGHSVTLDASGDSPASTTVQMTTDGLGSIRMESEASGAQGVTITIDYTTSQQQAAREEQMSAKDDKMTVEKVIREPIKPLRWHQA